MRALVTAVAMVVGLATPAMGAHPEGSTVEVSVGGEGYLELNGRRYPGPFVISAQSDGVAVVETMSLDTYLEGIREVPFSWDADALAAQAVAARTYLAWTLLGGRTRTGTRVGYDICATAACQVYAGVEAVLGADGDRWRAAVAETSGEILIHQGEPARAFYSSTTAGRTRNIEDIWPGSEPAPYLVGVPSTGEESPFVEWSWELPSYLMERLLRAAEVAGGRVHAIANNTTENGQGPWTIDIVSDTGTVSLDTWSLRARINEAASIMPDRLPASNDEGRVYPTTILSPEYTIRREVRVTHAGGDAVVMPFYIVEGGGWGHLIGMSQFGAQAMAEAGSSYPEILAHYYGGLTPVPGDEFLPDQVSVGLVVGAESVTVETDSFFKVTLDGEELEVPDPGAWSFAFEDGRLIVVPPPSGPPRVAPGQP
ncbi:MAG: SpoIID/LytB domain-containing protein, partial [Acidimicrobiia bacterium]